jgi:hypothetical protein
MFNKYKDSLMDCFIIFLCFGLLFIQLEMYRHYRNTQPSIVPPTISAYNNSDCIIDAQAKYIKMLEAIPPSPQSKSKIDLDNYIWFLIANTGSMRPTLDENSRVIVDKELVGIGDIVIFQNGGDSWIHRIVGEQGDFWITQGDATPQQQEYIPKKDILWRVSAIVY